jgi:hypothetical protein
MLKAFEQRIWWLTITFAGVCQDDAMEPGGTVLVIATLLGAIAHTIWVSLPQLRRDPHRCELSSSTPLRPAAGPKAEPVRTRSANNQEGHHAYP